MDKETDKETDKERQKEMDIETEMETDLTNTPTETQNVKEGKFSEIMVKSLEESEVIKPHSPFQSTRDIEV